ncbi:MAG: chemotaxis protein CheW [Candidatus Methanoperedens sp.]
MKNDTKQNQLVVFSIDEHRYALPLFTIERIVRAVDVTSLPKAPEMVTGIVNVQGRIIPVVSLRQRFGLPIREIGLNDQLIVARTKERYLAFTIDAALDVVTIPEKEVVHAEEILQGMEYVLGLIKQDDGLIHILDIDSILSSGEAGSLDIAMDTGGKT